MTLEELRAQGKDTCSVPAAAQVLGISRGHAYELAKEGVLPVLKLGRRLVVPLDRLQRMLVGEEQQA